MKFIILAAGQGNRLRPHTNDKPKCMVEYNGKPIIDYIINTAKECNISDISIVNGYKKKVLENHLKGQKVKFYTNNKFDSTNMVTSLFTARNEFNDDVIISYSDIIYKKEVLKKLIDSDSYVSVVVDKDWKNLWQLRMDNPLDDAETMKIDSNDNILELGKRAISLEQIQGQYIGLIKFSKNVTEQIKYFYYSLDKEKIYDGKDFENMYMTTFIQLIINRLCHAKAIYTHGDWIEIDSNQDLKVYEENKLLF